MYRATPREQWDPIAVAQLARDTLTDQADVSDRRDRKDGQALLDKFAPDPERYPAYYLQNFHYQTDGKGLQSSTLQASTKMFYLLLPLKLRCVISCSTEETTVMNTSVA